MLAGSCLYADSHIGIRVKACIVGIVSDARLRPGFRLDFFVLLRAYRDTGSGVNFFAFSKKILRIVRVSGKLRAHFSVMELCWDRLILMFLYFGVKL